MTSPPRTRAVLWLGIPLVLAFQPACEDEYADTPSVEAGLRTKQAKAEVKTKAETKTVKEQAEPAPIPYSYNPIGKRDPFRSYLEELSRRVAETRRVGRREETEEFELDQYRLTGIITGTAQPRAMVEDPNNRGHVLRVGSRLGKHGGRVTRISARGIVVSEQTRDATGKRLRVDKRINLPQMEPNKVFSQ